MGKKPAQKTKKTQSNAKPEAKTPVSSAQGASTDKVHNKELLKGKASHKAAISLKSRADNQCKIEGCKRAYRAKGYCGTHYKKWRRGEYGRARYKECYEEGCRRQSVYNRQGYCEEHYQQFYVKGIKPVPSSEESKPPKPANANATG